MAKEKSINPAQAQRKLEKQKLLKKGKAEQAARRNEKLARRNPTRIQRQIDDLRNAEASGGTLNTREKKLLEELERDLKAVDKAREALGDKAPAFGAGPERGDRNERRPSQYRKDDDGKDSHSDVLGKRRRGEAVGRGPWSKHGAGDDSDGSSTSESVKNIPMPEDSPPPIPVEYLNRPRRPQRRPHGNAPSNPNLEPLSTSRMARHHPLPTKPGTATASTAPDSAGPDAQRPQRQAQIIYESKPVVRDLRKEATTLSLMPSAVRQKMDAARGHAGKLLEPEEMDRLENEGYTGVPTTAEPSRSEQMTDGGGGATQRLGGRSSAGADGVGSGSVGGDSRGQGDAHGDEEEEEEGDEGSDGAYDKLLEEEERRFRTKIATVEDVADE